jgi:hypothetical protein
MSSGTRNGHERFRPHRTDPPENGQELHECLVVGDLNGGDEVVPADGKVVVLERSANCL